MSNLKWFCIWAGLCLLAVGSTALNELGNTRSEKITRYASMVDTSAEHSYVKSHHYYNTYGIFVDRETGLRFRDSIDDKLYRQFARDGNQPIAVSWPYSIDKREQTSRGIFYTMLAFVGWLIVCVCVAFIVSEKIIRHRKRRNCKDSWFGE